MRTAMRIALVLTGTAIFVAAMATPGARAGRNAVVGDQFSAVAGATASQRAQQQSRPDRIDYGQGSKVVNVVTAIAHMSPAPDVANHSRLQERTESRIASATTTDKAKNRSVGWAIDCDRDTFAIQQVNASDGGRGAVVGPTEKTPCIMGDKPERRTRQAVILEMEQMQTPRPESAPVVIKFEAVISINLAGVAW